MAKPEGPKSCLRYALHSGGFRVRQNNPENAVGKDQINQENYICFFALKISTKALFITINACFLSKRKH